MYKMPELSPDSIIIYLRKSRTDDPALTVSETLEKHEQMLDEWCMRNLGALVPEHNRFREIVSGETINARPEMQKVLRLIEQDKYKAILIVEPQRLSRGDLEDIGRLSKLLRYTQTLVITLQYIYDLTDERDRDYFERELKRGNEYLEYSKRIMMNGRALSAERGNYPVSRRPYGYERIFKKDGRKKYPTLRVVPDEAQTVRMIYHLYADGYGANAIASKLNAIGARPMNGGSWHPASIYEMLDNPIYAGKVRWRYRTRQIKIESGEVIVHMPRRKDCTISAGRHEPIIDPSLWETVRRMREQRTIPRVKSSYSLKNPLAGLLYCECGAAMIRKPESPPRYICSKYTICKNASCIASEIMDEVADAIRKSIPDIEQSLEMDAAQERHEEHMQMLKGKLEDNQRKEKSLWLKYTEGMPKEIFDSILADIMKQHDEISGLIAEAEANAPANYIKQTAMLSDALLALGRDDVPAEKLNALLKQCIRRITYSRKRGERVKGGRGGWTQNPAKIIIEMRI